MGLFSNIRFTLFAAKTMGKAVMDSRKLAKRSKTMTLAEAQTLTDEQLMECLLLRLDAEDEAELAAMPEAVRYVYTVLQYQAEVNNGGLCQYFVNSSRMTAPYLEEALSAIGAEQHCRKFHDFVTENGIDVGDLSSFVVYEVEEFEAQEKRFPYDAFDNAFYEMEESLDDLCAPYARQHLTDFFA